METDEVRPGEPTATAHTLPLLGLYVVSDIVAGIDVGGVLEVARDDLVPSFRN